MVKILLYGVGKCGNNRSLPELTIAVSDLLDIIINYNSGVIRNSFRSQLIVCFL